MCIWDSLIHMLGVGYWAQPCAKCQRDVYKQTLVPDWSFRFLIFPSMCSYKIAWSDVVPETLHDTTLRST